jgi:hypothetical protein
MHSNIIFSILLYFSCGILRSRFKTNITYAFVISHIYDACHSRLILFDFILSSVGVSIKTDFALDNWIYCTLYSQTVRDYRQYSAIAILHTLQFIIAHALGFSVFSTRMLATDISQSQCNFKSHIKSSFHILIPFLSLFCSRQFPRLDSIQLRPETRLLTSRLLFCTTPCCRTLLYKHFRRTTQKTQPLLLRRCFYRTIA